MTIQESCIKISDIVNINFNKFFQNENIFDYNFYINSYSDLKNLNEQQALNHWNNNGKKENRKCNIYLFHNKYNLSYFDWNFYYSTYKNEIKKHKQCNEMENALIHWITIGSSKKYYFNFFVKEATNHYYKHGIFEGRNYK